MLALIPASVKENGIIGVNGDLVEFVKGLGFVPLLMPAVAPTSLPAVDLVVLPGGADVDSKRFMEVPNYNNSKQDSYLEWFDSVILPYYVNNKTPIFGICRGLQTLAVHFGGSLVQDLYNHPKTSFNNEQHDVHYGKAFNYKLKVNSYHHQAVQMDKLPSSLKPMAIYNDTGDGVLVEALVHKTLPIAAVQWHPERGGIDFFTRSLIQDIMR